ncbi:unnamed protein product [Natator depressus]
MCKVSISLPTRLGTDVETFIPPNPIPVLCPAHGGPSHPPLSAQNLSRPSQAFQSLSRVQPATRPGPGVFSPHLACSPDYSPQQPLGWFLPHTSEAEAHSLLGLVGASGEEEVAEPRPGRGRGRRKTWGRGGERQVGTCARPCRCHRCCWRTAGAGAGQGSVPVGAS